jgi:hypothetical protein
LQHPDHVGACDTGAKKSVAIDLADVGDLVADGCNLADGSLEPLLGVLRPIKKPATGLRPDFRSEQKGR